MLLVDSPDGRAPLKCQGMIVVGSQDEMEYAAMWLQDRQPELAEWDCTAPAVTFADWLRLRTERMPWEN